MYQRLTYSYNYVKYLFFSKHRKGHGIHSPFMFNIITQVFNNKSSDVELNKVFKIYCKLKNSKELLDYNELGAGSKYSKKHKQTLGRIIKQESTNKKYGRLLFNLIRYYKSDNILELGTSIGISTAFIGMANPNSFFYSIEGIKKKQEIAQSITQELKLNTKFIAGNFDDILENTIDNYKKLDFVFFDGNHRKESTLKYFEVCLRKVHNESIFVFDDIHWSKEMEEAWNEIQNHKKVRVSVDLFRMGLIFFKKELSKQHYVIKY